MAKWKLVRQIYGNEEYSITEGEDVTLGRGAHNKIILLSAVISRNHCVINIKSNIAYITDLKSSNGVYVGKVKIPQNKPYVVQESNIIGLGWTVGDSLANIEDSEKYIFKLFKEKNEPLVNRLIFPKDCDFESKINNLHNGIQTKHVENSPILGTKLSLKRKVGGTDVNFKQENKNCEIINISDSDSEFQENIFDPKRIKLESTKGTVKNIHKDHGKSDDILEAFNVKQEYLGYDDEPIQVDSESDSESEQWLIRLSQSSPGKPFIKVAKNIKKESNLEESSYSQLDDVICNDFADDQDEEFMDDIISFPDQPHEKPKSVVLEQINKPNSNNGIIDEDEDLFNDIISINKPASPIKETVGSCITKDDTDGHSAEKIVKEPEKLLRSPQSDASKKVQMIEPLAKLPKRKSTVLESKSKSSKKHNKVEKSTSKKHISNSQKEERKKKLKEIAIKDKEPELTHNKDVASSNSKVIANVKVTSSNRGAFLTDIAHATVKPFKHNKEMKVQDNSTESSDKKETKKDKTKETKHDIKVSETKTEETKSKAADDVENNEKYSEKSGKRKQRKSKHKYHSKTEEEIVKKTNEQRVPLKNLEPLTDTMQHFSGKPVSKVEPLRNEKPKKKVRFSKEAPQIYEFEIEPGNKMRKTSMVKMSLVDGRQNSVFSLEKITLMKILRWNPQWLDEQMNNNEPPPILGHNNTPLTMFHSFASHNQYVQLIGDLLLMEIWECLTIAHTKIRSQNLGLQMRIESLPPVPSQDRCFDLFSFSVNVSVPSSEARNVPRVGEILVVMFGPDEAKNHRFFFVNNVRNLPSPPNNIHSFFSISLQATFTEKMKMLRPGELLIAKSLTYINKELMLFEAMEYLAGSPLCEAILKPEPHHFTMNQSQYKFDLKTEWTQNLNPSQLSAVKASVSAALSDKPWIQMVQGPPGTGKSSVICAMVMTYFYNAQGRKQQNRGKILICATSNAAVDGLVIRLLNLRQNLPKPERFRMVRVGRAEAMHALAANISSQQLARRDLARPADLPPPPAGYDEEILHLEAKINMWKALAQEAQDPVRVAYCQGRVSDLVKRKTLLRSGAGRQRDEVRPEQLCHAERRIIEGADIVVTTLASAHNFKVKGLKRRIALCIIDEAGQAIEPETLIPLTLDVTRLVLIGDPQQLPGFICSQRAKKHGLSESLFSRLASCSEQWPGGSPVVLLNQQYRMHPDIADYPSRAFYGGLVQNVPPTRPELEIPPYCIVSISSGDKGQGTSGANETEAWGVSRLVMALDELTRPLGLKLAVITPYNAHKELIKKNLRMLQSGSDASGEVEVNTIDSFQGQERDVVVVSLARSAGAGFLTDAGRVNVMLTRARHALLLCLNPHALIKNPQWRTLIEDSQRRHLYRVIPNKVCQPSTSTHVSNKDILNYITEKRSQHYCKR